MSTHRVQTSAKADLILILM